MNIRKLSILFVFAVIPVIAGFVFAAERKSDEDTAKIPQSPGIIIPGDQGSGTLSIVPQERDTTKIQYRNILYGGETDKADKQDRDKDSSNIYELPGPDQGKGVHNPRGYKDPEDPINKSFTLPPGADQARKSDSDRDNYVAPMRENDQDPTLRPTTRNGSPASRSSSYALQYVVDEPSNEYSPQDSDESMNSGPMDEEFSKDRDLGDRDAPDMGDSGDQNMPSDQDIPRDPGLSL